MLIRSSILVAGLGLLGPSMPTAQAQDYGEWRALTSDEEKARIAAVRPGSVAPAVVEADFDGDGTKDKVLIAIRKADGARRVIAVMGNRVHVIEPLGVDAPDGLGLADSGSDDTICGNAFQQLHKEACDDYPAHMHFRYCNGDRAAHVSETPGFSLDRRPGVQPAGPGVRVVCLGPKEGPIPLAELDFFCYENVPD